MPLQTSSPKTETQTSSSKSIGIQPLKQRQIVFGIAELVDILRHQLVKDTEARNLRKTAAAIGVSHPWLAKFRDGHAVCMGIINSLATHYEVKYQISNFNPEDLQSVSWEFPESP